MATFVLPDCVFLDYPEYPYDVFGEKAAPKWTCACGSSMHTEYFDDVSEEYVPVRDERKAEFIAAHSSCAMTCFKCHKVPVERPGSWCESCSEVHDSGAHEDLIEF